MKGNKGKGKIIAEFIALAALCMTPFIKMDLRKSEKEKDDRRKAEEIEMAETINKKREQRYEQQRKARINEYYVRFADSDESKQLVMEKSL